MNRLLVLAEHVASPPEALLGPIFALVGIIGGVWLTMVIARNYAVLRGIANPKYYAEFKPADAPPDWVERAARTFNNLMQLPILFWLVIALMMTTRTLDAGQLALAWVFVALRALHAVVYITWNFLPVRFGSWVAGVITLAVMWVRFGAQTWHLF